MQTKNITTFLIVLIVLVAATAGGYVIGNLIPDDKLMSGIPPLVDANIPPQTQNGYSVSIDGVYADAMRIIFAVHAPADSVYLIDQIALKDAHGEIINASIGSGASTDSSLIIMELDPVEPIKDRLNGKLEFALSNASPGEGQILAEYSFDLDIPVHPALTFEPKQSFVSVSGVKILLDRVIIAPAYTHIYLCYTKPSDGDWLIGSDTTLKIGNQQAGLNTYSLLFDSALGDMGKGGETDWSPPVETGRCVKIGFPIGNANPQSMTLSIPTLEQSVPEVISADQIAQARKTLMDWDGIDMEWHIVDHGEYPEWKKLPSGMSEQEAYKKFIGALGYIYNGQWEFNLQLDPQENSEPIFSTSTYGMAAPIPPATDELKIAATLPGRIRSFDVSPDGKTIAFATSQGLFLYDLETHENIHTLNETGNGFSVAWSPDGSKLAVGNIIMESGGNGKAHLTVWDTTTWKVIFEPKISVNTFNDFGAIAWSPNNELLAFSDHDRGLVVVDMATEEIVSQQNDFLTSPYDISWSPDGSRLIATGDLGYGFRRWRLDNDKSVRLYDQRADAAIQLAWSPDGERVASGHTNGVVCFWTAKTNKCDGFIEAHQSLVSSLVWSPDGSQLATGSGIIRIWDSDTGKPITSLGQNDKSIYTHLEWPAINQPLVSLETGYADNELSIVRFWDVDTGKILLEFQGASGSFGE